jgi:hypothetical protein
MSLVGSLEDLGLGDILQIVHLSGKSGVLALRGEVGEGQIVFERGLLRAATVRGFPQDLRELIGRRRALAPEPLADAVREARRAGTPLADVLVQRGLLTQEAIEDLRGQSAADAVLEMFRWQAGEFSFEVREYARGEGDLELAKAMNPQFLALEGTRQNDEARESDEAEESTDVVAVAPLGPGEDPFADEAPVEAATPLEADAEDTDTVAALDPTEDAPLAELATEEAPAAPPEARAPRAGRALAQPPPVVVIDPSQAALEWAKSALTGHARVHTFQHTELGIHRIRQYLLRRELPIVLLSSDTQPDPVSGARDVYDVAARLRRQAPRLSIVVVTPAGARPPARRRRNGAAPSAFAERPKDGALADARRGAERLELASALRAVVERLPESAPAATPAAAKAASGSPGGSASKVAPPQPSVASADLARLRDASAKLRERARQGEVLSNVISFAAQSFSRVALFMLREDHLVGMAQIGLGKAGGPDDAALRDVHLTARESSWVRRVLDTRLPVRGRPVDDGDHRLCVLLGNEVPSEAFLAPLESANRVVAVLYADNLPGRDLLPDTGALEVVMHEAGLALDRSLLERALSEAVDPARV